MAANNRVAGTKILMRVRSWLDEQRRKFEMVIRASRAERALEDQRQTADHPLRRKTCPRE